MKKNKELVVFIVFVELGLGLIGNKSRELSDFFICVIIIDFLIYIRIFNIYIYF